MGTVSSIGQNTNLGNWLNQPINQDMGTSSANAIFATRSVSDKSAGFLDPYRNLFVSVVDNPSIMSERWEKGIFKYGLRRVPDRLLFTSPEGVDQLFTKADQFIPGFADIAPEIKANWKRALVDNNKGREFFTKMIQKYKALHGLYDIADETIAKGPQFFDDAAKLMEQAKKTGNYTQLQAKLDKLKTNAKGINMEYDLCNIAKPAELTDLATKSGTKAAMAELFSAQRFADGWKGQWAAASGDNALSKTGDIIKKIHVNELRKILTPLKDGKILEGCARSLGWGLLAFTWAKNTVNAFRASRIEGNGVGKSLWKSAKMFMGQGLKLLTCWQTFNIGFEVGAGLYAIFGAGVAAGAALSAPALLCAIAGGSLVSAATHAIMSKFFPDAPQILT